MLVLEVNHDFTHLQLDCIVLHYYQFCWLPMLPNLLKGHKTLQLTAKYLSLPIAVLLLEMLPYSSKQPENTSLTYLSVIQTSRSSPLAQHTHTH